MKAEIRKLHDLLNLCRWDRELVVLAPLEILVPVRIILWDLQPLTKEILVASGMQALHLVTYWDDFHPSYIGDGVCQDAMSGCYNIAIAVAIKRENSGTYLVLVCWKLTGSDEYYERDLLERECVSNPEDLNEGLFIRRSFGSSVTTGKSYVVTYILYGILRGIVHYSRCSRQKLALLIILKK